MSSYKVEISNPAEGITLFKLAFGEPATNDMIVKDAVKAIKDLNLKGGPLALFNGPASLPVAFAISHAVVHVYGALAVYDPKLSGYVVAVSHNPNYAVGAIIPPP